LLPGTGCRERDQIPVVPLLRGWSLGVMAAREPLDRSQVLLLFKDEVDGRLRVQVGDHGQILAAAAAPQVVLQRVLTSTRPTLASTHRPEKIRSPSE